MSVCSARRCWSGITYKSIFLIISGVKIVMIRSCNLRVVVVVYIPNE